MERAEIAGIGPIAEPQQLYWPQLDGVRALAILLVLAVHTDGNFVGGGLGVDLFFVLSGFLITSLLLKERVSTGRIAIANFYARRVLRLLPALVLMIVLVVIIDRLPGAVPTDLTLAIPVVLLYVTNWVWIYTPKVGAFQHCWSLAIEEQFYLVWPWVIRRWAQAHRLAETFVGIAIVIMIARTGWAYLEWRGSDYITFFRADGLLLGAALAVVITRRAADGVLRGLTWRWLTPLALVGLVIPVGVLVAHHGPVTRSLALSCAVVAGTALIGSVVMVPSSLVARVLRTRPLMAIGRVSYGIYLFNFPIFIWVQSHHWSAPTKLIVEYSALALVTVASWRLVEQPALRLRRRFPARVSVA